MDRVWIELHQRIFSVAEYSDCWNILGDRIFWVLEYPQRIFRKNQHVYIDIRMNAFFAFMKSILRTIKAKNKRRRFFLSISPFFPLFHLSFFYLFLNLILPVD